MSRQVVVESFFPECSTTVIPVGTCGPPKQFIIADSPTLPPKIPRECSASSLNLGAKLLVELALAANPAVLVEA